MAAPQTQDERDRGWWARWREQDFTWDGLAKREWEGWVVSDGVLVVVAATGRRYGGPEPKEPKPVTGRSATLQDYWRADPATGQLRDDDAMAAELVAADGHSTYHRVHLPLAHEDATATPKAEWPRNALDVLVEARLAAAFETEGYGRPIDGPDGRAQFQGGVWLNAPAHRDPIESPLSLRYEFARFVGDANFVGAAFSGYAYFREAAFSGYAYFREAAFSGHADFSEAAFSGYADFSEAAFSGNAFFREAAFSGYADFREAAFSGDADFSEAAFSGDADFREAAFSGNAYFREAAFSGNAYFREAAFSGNAYFREAAFSGYADFSEAAFSGNADFREAAFSGNADFREAAFSGYAYFRGRGALLSNPKITQPVALRPEAGDTPGWIGTITTPVEPTELAQRCFNGLDVTGAVFAGDADFSNREFLKKTDFPRARFHGLALFHGSRLHQDTSFLNARFGDHITRDEVRKRAGGFSAVVRDAWIKLTRTEPGSVLPRIPDAALARLYETDKRLFDVRQMLKATKAGSEPLQTEEARRAALEAVLPFAEWEADYRKTWAERAQNWFASPDADTRFKDMESAFRTLKLAMETNRDRAGEGRFFRLELLARRQRRDDQVPFWERVTSRLYGALADYGDSIARPLGWLFALLLVMGAVYWGIGAQLNSHAAIFVPEPASVRDCRQAGKAEAQCLADERACAAVEAKCCLHPVKGDEYCKKYNVVRAQIGTIQMHEWRDGLLWSEHDMWSALTFSWNNVFRPFSALSAEAVGPYEPSWASSVLYGYGPGYGLAVRVLASVQSLVSILLVFLFALAMRRRFQIS